MIQQCESCGSTEIEWVSATPMRPDEPAGSAGWECLDCGAFTPDPSYEWERAVSKAENDWDDRGN